MGCFIIAALVGACFIFGPLNVAAVIVIGAFAWFLWTQFTM